MQVEFPPELSKELILNNVAEEQVFEFYGLSVLPGMFRSPLRIDKKPTCQFYRNRRSGQLYYRDYGFEEHHFDCFGFVQWKYNLKFMPAIRQIALDMGIIKSIDPNREVVNHSNINQVTTTIRSRPEPKIRIESMKWKHYHVNFWKQYGITEDTLDFYKVKPIRRAWLNDIIQFEHGENNDYVGFAYCFGGYDYKLYFPLRDKFRFLHNKASVLQGESQLVELLKNNVLSNDIIVVTKALKDVMLLYQFGVPAIAPMAESQIISKEVYDILSENYAKVISLYDFDQQGIRSMRKMWAEFRIEPRWIRRFCDSKDFTDLYRDHGESVARQFAESLFN